MAFDWMTVSRRPDRAGAFQEQFERSIRERALLLFNLGYGADAASDRITSALKWEFDSAVWPKTAPGFVLNVRPLVDGVFSRQGRRHHQAP